MAVPRSTTYLRGVRETESGRQVDAQLVRAGTSSSCQTCDRGFPGGFAVLVDEDGAGELFCLLCLHECGTRGDLIAV